LSESSGLETLHLIRGDLVERSILEVPQQRSAANSIASQCDKEKDTVQRLHRTGKRDASFGALRMGSKENERGLGHLHRMSLHRKPVSSGYMRDLGGSMTLRRLPLPILAASLRID